MLCCIIMLRYVYCTYTFLYYIFKKRYVLYRSYYYNKRNYYVLDVKLLHQSRLISRFLNILFNHLTIKDDCDKQSINRADLKSAGVFLRLALGRHLALVKFYGVERLIFTVVRRAKRSRSERRTKTSGKTSCSTKTRRYSKAVCSTHRD